MKNISLNILLVVCSFAACNAQQKNPVANAVTDSAYTTAKASVDGIGKFYYGREIAQVMGAAGAPWLDRQEREQEENTKSAVDKINIADTGAIADIGAGTGHYTFQLSKKFPHGKIYAVEIQDEMISELNKRKKNLKAANVEVIKGTTLSLNLPANSIDLAIMVDVYHELEHPREMIAAIKKALRTNGKILLIEYRGEDPSVPIKPLHKMTVKQADAEMKAAGFTLDYKGDFLPIQHFLLYKKD